MTPTGEHSADVIILRRHGEAAVERGGIAFWEIFRRGVVELSSIRTYEEAKRRGERLAREHRVALVYLHTPTRPNPRVEVLSNFTTDSDRTSVT